MITDARRRIAKDLKQRGETRRDAVRLSVHADGSVSIGAFGQPGCVTLSRQQAFRLAARLIVLVEGE